MTVRLIHELEKYRTMLPALKYVRGDVFSEKHWIEMYSLLGIPTNITVDKLTFGHFLKVCSKELVPVIVGRDCYNEVISICDLCTVLIYLQFHIKIYHQFHIKLAQLFICSTVISHHSLLISKVGYCVLISKCCTE